MAPFSFRLEQVRRYRKQLEEQAMQALAHLTEDHAEGVDAVLNKRPANFTGR